MVVYDYYRIFYYVAQYKSFTRAAEVLGVTFKLKANGQKVL